MTDQNETEPTKQTETDSVSSVEEWTKWNESEKWTRTNRLSDSVQTLTDQNEFGATKTDLI